MAAARRYLVSQGEAPKKLHLDGVNNHVVIKQTVDVEYELLNGFSMALSFISETSFKQQPLISKGVSYSTSSNGYNRSFNLSLDVNNNVVLEMFKIDYTSVSTTIPYVVEIGIVQNMVVTYSFTTGVLTCDINNFSYSTTVAPFGLNKSTTEIVIGDNFTSDTRSTNQPFKGTISNISIWKEALNSRQIKYVLSNETKDSCQIKSKGILNYNSDNCLLFSPLVYGNGSPIDLSKHNYPLEIKGNVLASSNIIRTMFNNGRVRYTVSSNMIEDEDVGIFSHQFPIQFPQESSQQTSTIFPEQLPEQFP